MSDNGWDDHDGRTYAERVAGTCDGCRFQERRGVGGCPPWPICTVDRQMPYTTDNGRSCNRYSPNPWLKEPVL